MPLGHVTRGALAHLAFLQRENDFRHHTYEQETEQFHYLRLGDVEGVARVVRGLVGEGTGTLSPDPLRNAQYLFVAYVTTATRYAIEGGLPQNEAYNISDLYIQQADRCATPEAVSALVPEMMAYFTRRVAEARKAHVASRPVTRCLDEIDLHLHEVFHIGDIAELLGLNPSYLSTLFKRETGCTFTDYVRRRRVEAARNMLLYSDYSCADIAHFLAFSSQSYFNRVFQRETGLSPGAYRARYSRRSLESLRDARADETK